jgi:hypothetical protein
MEEKLNNNRIFILASILITLLNACSPSAQAIQTVIVETQETNPTSTFTPIPPTETPTITPTNSCTNKGWNKIDNYLNQYRHQDDSYVQGSDINAYLASLTNIKNQVNETEIDACTEYARQLLVTGLEKRIDSYHILLTGGSAEDAIAVVKVGNAMIDDAIAELRKMGIYVSSPY